MVDLRAVGACAVVAALLVDDGGYFARSWGWSGAVGAGAAALGIAWLRRAPRAGPELLLVGGLAALALWALLSAAWSQSPPSSVAEAQRGLVPLAAALAALVLFRRRDARLLAGVVLGAVTLVSLANLVHRARDGESDLSGVAAEPIGYDNALGLLAALGVLLALDVGARRGRWRVAVATLPLNAFVLVLSESTGAYLALAAGLTFAAVVAGGRLRLAGIAALVALVVLGVALAGGHERERYWSVALGAARDEPVAGAGAGTFWQLWLEERDVPLDARDAHGLYVETLGELGAVGLLLVLTALAAPAVAVLRGSGRPLLAGAYAAFLVHAGIDWDWEFAGVAVVGVLIGCALLLDARDREEPELPPRSAGLWAAGAAGLFLATAVTLIGASVLDRATAAERDGRPVDALLQAERAASLQPWASEPWLVVARARRASGQGDAAEAAREGLERDGNDWRLWLELAQSTEGAERERALARARSLNPFLAVAG